ncbi:MAG: hypothetical protein HC853_12005 [Anaerolineae bacterium]|nr:hypothetical protein [Anaerolineae bacterium]
MALPTLYRYLFIAERLSSEAKNLARAYGIGNKRLQVIARLPDAQQAQAVLEAARAERDEPRLAAKDQRQNRSPVPMCERGLAAASPSPRCSNGLGENHLARASAQERASLLDELELAASEIARTLQRLRAISP